MSDGKEPQNFLMPGTPIGEDSRTSSIIPEDLTNNQLETIVDEIYGKIEIIRPEMFRDMPECRGKGWTAPVFSGFWYEWLYQNRIFISCGTVGILHTNNNLLSPDSAAFDMDQRPCNYEEFEHEHMFQLGPAPNWILEYEWSHEIYQQKKGVDKILNYFFNDNYIGSNNTRVEVAWLLVKTQNVHIEAFTRLNPILSFLHVLTTIPFIGIIILQALYVFDWFGQFIGINFSGKAYPEEYPPEDPSIPYLAIYFPNTNPIYYYLRWNKFFSPPENSFFATAPRFPINHLLDRLIGSPVSSK